jgi:hypothetical protein
VPALACKVGGKCYTKFCNVESSFWRADNGQNTVFEWFSKFECDVISVEDAEYLRYSSSSKIDENRDQKKKNSSMKLLKF